MKPANPRPDQSATGRRVFACRVDKETPAIIDGIAAEFDCYRITGDGYLVGACGVMLDRIAQGKLKVVPA